MPRLLWPLRSAFCHNYVSNPGTNNLGRRYHLPTQLSPCTHTDERSAMSIHTPYTSELYTSDEIRLVCVSAGQWHEQIRCKLIRRELHKATGQPYRALSYVWGSSSVTDTIELQWLPFQITLNLSCALRHLRRVDGDIFLWVDALVSILS